MSSTLLTKQQLFSKMVVKLISFAHLKGYEVTLGDAYRDPRVFGQLGERKGYGESRSAHKQRLAIDLNIFKDGRYLQSTADHKELGEYWESIGGAWGGRFEDGNHYSLEHDGIK
jgi:uncharacterized protein YdbL (DUF1318 family)